MSFFFHFDKKNRLWLFEGDSEMSINHIIYGAVTIHRLFNQLILILMFISIIGRTRPSLNPARLFNLRANKRQ